MKLNPLKSLTGSSDGSVTAKPVLAGTFSHAEDSLDGLGPEPEPEPLARQQSNASDSTGELSWF